MFQGLSPLSRGGKEGQLGEWGDSGTSYSPPGGQGAPSPSPTPSSSLRNPAASVCEAESEENCSIKLQGK